MAGAAPVQRQFSDTDADIKAAGATATNIVVEVLVHS